MAFTVFYTVQISDVATKIFEAAGGKTVVTNHFFDEAGYIEELKELKPEAIMCRTEPITAAMMDAAGPNLKVIGKQGAGLDNIDVEAATARKIRVVYAPGQNAQSVAEQSVFLMLACARRFNYVDRQFRSGNYKVRFGLEHTYELQGKTLGLVGCGRIGRMLAGIAKNGFGMNVIGYDPFLKQEQLGDLITLVESQDEVFKQADFINIVAWRHTAEFVAKYFTKGLLVAVEGSIQTRNYQDKDGNNRTAFEVVADQVYFAEKKGAGNAQNSDFVPPPFEEPAKGSSFSVGDLGDFEEFDADDSDLPF